MGIVLRPLRQLGAQFDQSFLPSRELLRAATQLSMHVPEGAVCSLLVLLLFVCNGSLAAAQAPRALPSLLATPRMLQPDRTSFALAGGAGYGIREPLDGHHQPAQLVVGALGASVQTRSGFGVELRVDGRHDRHGRGGARNDDGTSMVGAPRAYLRYARALRDGLTMGAELAAFVPGGKAPSLKIEATTLDALLGLEARLTERWSLLSGAGFRYDQSGKAFPHPERLSPGDFAALGLSDSHAVLVRLGAQLTVPNMQLFSEWTSDLLVGGRAPAVAESPMHVAVGARTPLTPSGALRLLTALRVLVSQRPAVDVQGPLLPFPARATLWLGLSYELAGQKRPAVVARAEQPEATPFATEPAAPQAAAQEPPRMEPTADQRAAPSLESAPSAASGQLRFLVRDNRSGEPLRANVIVRPLGGAEGPGYEHQIGADGRLEITLEPGRYEVEIKLYGWRKQKKTVSVEHESVTMMDVGLHARSKQRERER